jgi:peptidoglycan/LPS O-acetylase OafA/YrhL
VTLRQVFDPRCNALTAWRLVLAIGVILWHSWPLTGREIPYEPVVQLLSEVFADGFFTISGFLITASWMRRPYLREYWTARTLRIFPGLWVCLLVVAFVIAPLAAAIQHVSVSFSSEAAYVLNNGVTNVFYAGIDGTPTGVPYPGVWNASIWTLFFVLLCDVMVSVLGFVGLLKRRWTIPVLFVLAVCSSAYVSYPTNALQTWPQMLARFALMFLAGAMFYRYQDRIPARWSLVALSVAILVASEFIENYRVIAALPLAYAIIVSGALIKNRRLNLQHDLSYGVYIYAFPMQQLLATCGLARLNSFVFFVLAAAATLPVAALSWFVVEKRSVALKRRLFKKPAEREPLGASKPSAGSSVAASGSTSQPPIPGISSEGHSRS